MPERDLEGQIAGLTGVIVSLILVLERTQALDRKELASEVKRAYDDLDPASKSGSLGRFMAQMASYLEPPDPENPPPRPNWLRVIQGGRDKSS